MAIPNQIVIDSTVNNVDIITNDNQLTIISPVCNTEVTVTQPLTTVVQVATPGPQGQKGELNPDNSGSFNITGSLDISGSLTLTGSLVVTGSATFVGPVAANVIGSLLGTASYADQATSASYALSSSYAVSASYAFQATSASYALSASYAVTSSYAEHATSASYALSASYAVSASYASASTSASYASASTSASYAFQATSASYALTASYLNPLQQDVQLTGSLYISGAIASVEYLDFDLNNGITNQEGRLYWNPDDGTLNVGLEGGAVTLQVGQETLYPYVVNKDSVNLGEGTLVMVDPTDVAQGNRLRVVRAITDGTYPSQLLVGVLTENININQQGFATWFGYVRNLPLNTLRPAGETWVEGNILYPNPNIPGGLTNIRPGAPAIDATIAAITAINGNNLTLLVRPTLTVTLDELNDVAASGSVNGDLLVKSGSVWIHGKALSGSYVVTGSVTISGSSTFTNIGPAVFSGSISQTANTASLSYVTASVVKATSFTGSFAGTASNATSASYAVFATSASYASASTSASYANFATTASFALNVNPAATASYALQALSASYALSGSYTQFATSASYASASTSASYASASTSASYSNFATSASYASTSTSASYALSASYAVSASQASRAVTASFADTIASGLDITASNLQVIGNITASSISATSASFGYVQQVTGSAVIIGEEFIILNADTPAARYAGIIVYDTGSFTTASLEWDGVNDYWIQVETNGESAAFLTGPSGSKGLETLPTANKVLKGTGTTAVADSNITDDGSTVSISTPLVVTGSVRATSFTGSFSGSVTAPGATTQIVYNSAGVLAADSGLVYSGSNVGIGTTNPKLVNYGRELVVSQTSGSEPEAFLVLQGNRTGDNNIGGLSFYNTTSSLASIAGRRSGANNSGALTFLTSNAGTLTERLRILPNGTVGIGTSTAPDKLTVADSAGTSISITTNQIPGSSASPLYTDLNFRGYLNTPMARIRSWDESFSTADGYLTFWTNDFTGGSNVFTEKMRITPTGNVGIGLTVPSASLHISGASSANLLRIDSPASSSILFVSGSGNVGIGSSNPDAALLISGDFTRTIKITGTTSNGDQDIRFNRLGLETWTLGRDNTGNDFKLSYAANNVGGLGTGDLITVKSTGNVGIGETTPTSRLQVKGSGTTSSTTTLRIENANQSASIVALDNGLVGIGIIPTSASLHVNGNAYISASASTSSAALTVYKSGSTVLDVQGSQGQLFSITDSLSGSLFSVNDISGLPILEVFSDNTILMGDYLAPSLNTTEKLTVNSGVTTLYALPTASYDGAFFDYTIRSGSNARAGQIMGIWSGTSVNFTETTTVDFGNTSGFIFGMSISGSNMILSSSAATSGWTLKAIIRSI